jgi:hypothetical protein
MMCEGISLWNLWLKHMQMLLSLMAVSEAPLMLVQKSRMIVCDLPVRRVGCKSAATGVKSMKLEIRLVKCGRRGLMFLVIKAE